MTYRGELQRPGVRGPLRTCPSCGAKRVRWYAGTANAPASLECGKCGAHKNLPRGGVDLATVEAVRLTLTRPGARP